MGEKCIDAVVAGHICIDITPQFSDEWSVSAGEIFRPGQLIQTGPPIISSGGAVSNTGLALKRLGLEVSLMGKCGADRFGELLLETIGAEAPGAEAGMSVKEGEDTSYSIVIAPPGIDRIFLHCPGANDTFGAGDVDLDIAGQAKVFHFGYPPLMQRMYDGGGRELASVMAAARRLGAVTSLDMALPDPQSESGRAAWRGILSAVLPHTCIFLPSVEEIMFMLRRERFEELSATDGGIVESVTAGDLRILAGECLDLGADVIVIKCGRLGAYLKSRKSLRGPHPAACEVGEWEDAELFGPACLVDGIKNATGAGDNAIAGFLAAYVKGMGPGNCLRALSVVGAHNLSSVSAVGGVRPWGQTLAEMKSSPAKTVVPARLADLPVLP